MAIKAQRREIGEGRGEKIRFADGDRLLSLNDVLALWRESKPFRELFIAELAATAYSGFFWEMPPVRNDALSEKYECAVIRSDALARLCADDSDFAEHLNASTTPVVVFPNLGGDALLISPRRISDADCYAHIAAFVRKAPPSQQHALFQLLGVEAETLLGTGHRFWISTSGLGVPWVHMRLDSCPKYYQYRPYAEG